jgi:hypothetical protein
MVQGITLELNFWGLLGATGNNKRVRLWVDPTLVGATINPATGAISGGSVSGAGAGALLYDSGTQTGNNVPWMLSSFLSKIGPNGANSQNFITQPIFNTTHGGVVLPAGGPAIALNESVSHNFVLTVASQTSGVFDDVELWDTQIVGWN